MTKSERDALRKMEAEATPGPWVERPGNGDWHHGWVGRASGGGIAYSTQTNNAVLIAAARNALMPLLDALDEADYRIKELEKEVWGDLDLREQIACLKEAQERVCESRLGDRTVERLEEENRHLRAHRDSLQAMATVKIVSNQRDRLRGITEHPMLSYDAHGPAVSVADRNWQLGFTDGLRTAAIVARAALAALCPAAEGEPAPDCAAIRKEAEKWREAYDRMTKPMELKP